MDEKNRGEALADALRARGLVSKHWWEMGAAEQLAIAGAAADYDDALGNVDATEELRSVKHDLEEIESRVETDKEEREEELRSRGLALIERDDAFELSFAGETIEGVEVLSYAWDAESERSTIFVRLRGVDGPDKRLGIVNAVKRVMGGAATFAFGSKP